MVEESVVPASPSTTEPTRRFGLAVVGLGRVWEVRHRPALERLADRFDVVSVYDEVPARARREADRLRRDASASVVGLIERDDVEAVLLSSPQWFGLHLLLLACERRKPVYLAVPPGSASPEFLDVLDAAVRTSGVPVVPEFARRVYPATERLIELLAARLGRPRTILSETRVAEYDRQAGPGPSTQTTPGPLLVDPGSFLVDWCRHVMGDEPVGVEETPAPDGADLHLRFVGGGAARVEIVRRTPDAPVGADSSGLHVVAERGQAWISPPDRLRWSDDSGIHDERFPTGPEIGEKLLTGFHGVLSGRPDAAPNWTDAVLAARIVQKRRGD